MSTYSYVHFQCLKPGAAVRIAIHRLHLRALAKKKSGRSVERGRFSERMSLQKVVIPLKKGIHAFLTI